MKFQNRALTALAALSAAVVSAPALAVTDWDALTAEAGTQVDMVTSVGIPIAVSVIGLFLGYKLIKRFLGRA